ncbi:nuclear transport factor 2 family protein [Rubrimonas cliftonensis]|uniref:Ketosteroid isomerase-related protein n=1 Tax=Rubrimonas cliftonensis TaxID=89524 RepID=A0A1H3YFW6_9RHOB|nr:nuclear transport factor 2 family protein [Rubrimonas cliftonensis]SEA10490.1 Ketosteroid isomerase-related protein [Rubrimonas cliftonensis]
MTIHEIARAFTAACAEGRDADAQAFWADDVVSVEAMSGPMARAEGREALLAKARWWHENHEIHGVTVEGPWPNGDQFAVKFWMDVTPKGAARMQMDEIGLYTVRDGRIVEERFFYVTE